MSTFKNLRESLNGTSAATIVGLLAFALFEKAATNENRDEAAKQVNEGNFLRDVGEKMESVKDTQLASLLAASNASVTTPAASANKRKRAPGAGRPRKVKIEVPADAQPDGGSGAASILAQAAAESDAQANQHPTPDF